MNYNDYGIYELRNYARSLGVKSPTTKKKVQLIEEIKNCKKHKINKNLKSKIGRPPRYLYLDENLQNKKENIIKIKKLLNKIQILIEDL